MGELSLEDVIRDILELEFRLEGVVINVGKEETDHSTMSSVRLTTYISRQLVRLPEFKHTLFEL